MLYRLYLGTDVEKTKDEEGNSQCIAAVVDDNMKSIPKTFEGLPVRTRFRKMSNYPSLKAMYGDESGATISKDDTIKMESLLREKSDSLMKLHSNLEIITISATKFKDSSEAFLPGPCFVLYCTLKGLIPMHESAFPDTIGNYPVDVREGMFYLYGNGDARFPSSNQYFKNLQMGCNIGGASRFIFIYSL